MKVLFFDWHYTLTNSVFWESMMLSDLSDYEKVRYSLTHTQKDLLTHWMRGEYTSEVVVQKVAADSVLSYNYLFDKFVESASNMEFASSEIPELLNKLHKKYKLVIAANDTDSFIRWTIPSLNLDEIFDNILVSWNLKYLKEDFTDNGESLFFRKYLKDNSLKPKDCLLFDNSEDYEGKISEYGIKYQKLNSADDLSGVLKSYL